MPRARLSLPPSTELGVVSLLITIRILGRQGRDRIAALRGYK